MSSQPSLSKSAKEAPQNQPTGLACVFSLTSSNVPSPRLRSRTLPDAICWKTSTNPNPDCLNTSQYSGMSVFQTPCRQQLSIYRSTVGSFAYQASSERILVE